MELLSDAVRFLFVGVFGLSAVAHAVAPAIFRIVYRGADHPAAFAQVLAIPQALAALFLALPHTHIWGCAIAALILFMVVVTMLQHGRYAFALLGIVVMTALPVALVAAPLA